MALVTMNFESQYLMVNHEISVILPDKPREQSPADFYGSGKKYPVLWLLHGTFGDHSDWVRKSNIELYACENDIIVVMLSALNSDYWNWPGFGTGYNAWDYLTEELMPLIYNWFPASDKREDNFIAGLSMGGYGALKCALRAPETYCAAASLSGAVDVSALTLEKPAGECGYWEDVFGPAQAIAGSENDLFAVSERLAASGKALPKLYMWCGTEDGLYGQNVRLRDHLRAKGYDLTYEESPGDHQWKYWDEKIQTVLSWLPISKPAKN